MILFILRYFKGYLKVSFEGVYSERILSVLADENIKVWHLKYKSGIILCRMFAKDFKRIRGIRKKTGVKIKIVGKCGFPFIWKGYNHRFGFLIGAVLFFVLLKFFSTFVWVINVDGNNTVKSADIINTLSSIGITERMKKSDINAKISAQNLLMQRNDLAWASLNIEGCVLNVNVSEIEKKPSSDEAVPSNLIAKEDGIIKKIDAVSGDVRVKVGENVHKGDILVSGIIESMSSTAFVNSNAVVLAQVERNYIEKELFVKSIKKNTGKVSNNRVLEVLGVKIPLYLPKSENDVNLKYTANQAVLFGKKIPVKIYNKSLSYYQKNQIVSNEEQLKNRLSAGLKEFLDSKEIEGYIPIGTEYFTDDDGVSVSHRYLCDINIAAESKILLGQ